MSYIKIPTSHRVYYTCIEHNNEKICEKGKIAFNRSIILDYITKTYEFDTPISQYKHVCAFAASPEDLDKHFESKYPDHKVVESLESRLKPKELPKPVTKSWF